MAGYAKDVLVETDWLAEHAKDPNVRVFEVDVDTTAYDQGHVPGAVGLNWKTDLQQQPVRDLIENDRPFLRRFEPSRLRLARAGKCAALVTEQLSLE